MCTLIGGIVLPDRQGHGFLVVWGETLVGMLERRVVYAWVPWILPMIYFHLHDIAYRYGQSMRSGTTLLMVWVWEHIAIFYPPMTVDVRQGSPYAFRYARVVTQHHVGDNRFYMNAINTINDLMRLII